MNLWPKDYLANLLEKIVTVLKLGNAKVLISVTVPDTMFGDYATNISLILAKSLKRNPIEIAAQIVAKAKELDKQNVFSEITELKGFINFRISQETLLKNLSVILEQKDVYGKSDLGQGKTVIVEYFQNNVAKPPHIGHLRSAVQGDSLLRIFRLLGFNAISDTHIGDWGTQFGILIYAFKTLGDKKNIEKDPINELNKLYVQISQQIEENPDLREKGKAEFKRLEEGDKENRKLWQWFVDESLKDFERYRQLLGLLEFDYNLGESFYESHMLAVVEELEAKGLVTVGETGEKYVDLEDYKMGRCILVKSDGATTYLLRDFATYLYRKKEFDFYKNIYVVDNRQSHHFNQLFKVLELAGYPATKDSVHVDFGFMSLSGGAISTRKGTVISLQNLIDEAQRRALEIIEEKNPDLADKSTIAKKVALAAIKYFDLAHNCKSNFIFEWDKALSFEGNTGPYLQYTHARIHGILRTGKVEKNSLGRVVTSLNLQDLEIDVLRKLQQFNQVLEAVLQNYMSHYLCNYLFELAQTFNRFYQAIPVLKETDEQLRNFRLQLITATAQVIKNGMNLLGVEAPEAM